VADFDNNSQLTLKNRKSGGNDDIKYSLTLDAKIKKICVL